MNLRAQTLMVLLFVFLGLSAQPVCTVRTFTLRDGLAAHNISSFAQSSDDLMWLATWNGLCCFDGYNFQTFRSRQGDKGGLTTNRLIYIRVNSHDDVWCIAYDRQLFLFDTHTCQFRSVANLITKAAGRDVDIRTVFPLANGRTWIGGTAEGEIFVSADSLIRDGEGIEKPQLKELNEAKLIKAFLDQYGNDWITTEKTTITANGDRTTRVRCDFFAEAGKNVVLASKDGKVFVFKNNGKHSKIYSIGGVDSIRDMQPIDDSRMAMATTNGVVVLDVNSGTYRTVAEVGSDVQKLFVDSRNEIWAFGLQPGVWLIDRQLSGARHLQAVSLNPADRTESTSPLFRESDDGTIWLIPTDGTFCYFDRTTGNLVPYALRMPIFPSMPFPLMKRFAFDRQGNLWFTDEHILSLVSFGERHYSYIPVVNNEDVRSVATDPDGNLWIGMVSGEVALASPDGQLKGFINAAGQLQTSHCVLSDKVYALMVDKGGRLWIGTKGDGIYVREPGGAMRHYKKDDASSLPSNDIYGFDIAPDGYIWIATFSDGPCIVDEAGGSVKFLSVGKGINGYPKGKFMKVRRVTHTNDGTMLLSTNAGLVIMRKTGANTYKSYVAVHVPDDTTSLLTGDVMQTLVTRNGDIYTITMGGGMQKLVSTNILSDKLKFRKVGAVNREEGMIQSALEDRMGRIWIIRETSVDCYDAGKDSSIYYNGSPAEQLNLSEAQPTTSPDGSKLYIGALGGVMVLTPANLKKSSFVPRIVFTEVKFQGEDRTHPILNTDELDVPSDKRNLTIYFSALDYRDNYGIRYAYKIDGTDKEWSYSSRSHSASFNHLPKGHIRLLVRSTNSDGIWTDNVTVLNIYSHPTFWETGWAKLLYLFILCCLIALGIYIYTLRTKIKDMLNDWTEHLRELKERRAKLAEPEVVNPDELFMKHMKEYLSNNLTNTDMKIDDIAEYVNMSRSAFQTKVKELTGLKPIDYVTKVRMDRAKYLLKNSHENVNQIAYSVGYSDPKYFSRVFKRLVGETPTQYKARMEQTNEE